MLTPLGVASSNISYASIQGHGRSLTSFTSPPCTVRMLQYRLLGRFTPATHASNSRLRSSRLPAPASSIRPGYWCRITPSTAIRASDSDCQASTQNADVLRFRDNASQVEEGRLSSVASLLHQAAAQGSQVMLHLALALCMTAIALLPSVAFLTPPSRAHTSHHLETTTQAVTVDSSSSSSSSRAPHTPPVLYTTATPLEELLKEADRQLEARVGSAIDALSSGRPSSEDGTGEEARQFNELAREVINEVWEVVDQNYLDARRRGFDHVRWAELREEALHRTYRDRGALERSIKNMLARGLSDPYTRYVPPKDFEAMAKYDVTGIGLNLGTAQEFVDKTGMQLRDADKRDDRVWVVGVIYGSNSDKAGIQQGDAIVAVDGQRLNGLSPFQVASLIQGTAAEANAGGAPSQATAAVTLEVQKREGSLVTKTVEKPIRVIPTPVTDVHVEKKKKRGDVGYLRLVTFNARAQKDLSAAIQRLDGQGVDEFVLDLRDNYGGLVSEGIEVARLFLDDNAPIVFTRGQRDRSDAPTAPGPALTNKPLTVLVNEHSASASEILAGALKDNCRAVLVGKKTYGKGLIQSVYALSDGSGLITTVGKYLTPSLTDIDLYGIQPDFESLPSPDKAADALNACRLRQQK